MTYMHLAQRLAETARQYPDRPATRIKDGDGWHVETYAQFFATSRHVAAHLMDDGLGVGDRIAIWGENTPQWTQVDVACLMAGVASVPLYHTSTSEQVLHIFNDSDVQWAFVDGQYEYDIIAEVAEQLPTLRGVVSFTDVEASPVLRVRKYAEFTTATETSAALNRRLLQADPAETATIIYTSGTTGAPKGVVLSNRAFCAEMDSLAVFLHAEPEDHSLSFLPLSHALERGWTYFVLTHGCMNTYCTDPKKIAKMLVEAQPTLLASVPRLYEKIYAAAKEKASSTPAKRKIFEWALRVGGQTQRAYQRGRKPSVYWRAQLPLADKLVFSNIRAALGGRKTIVAAGGAHLRQEIEEFFSACGILILQGYGMTEAAPLISFNSPDAFKFGTVGRVMQNGKVRIDTDGEILYTGPNLMDGYLNNPEGTAEAIDADGWLHTGDIGYVDTQGFLVITDRKKDLLVTSGGKNVAPQPIEGMVLSDPLFEHAVLLGNDRPFLTLLVQPSFQHVEKLAEELKLRWETREELLSNQQIVDEVKKRVAALTAKLPSHEQIKDLRIALEDFTQDNDLLTPTLKVKRKQVEATFHDLIEEMYAKLAEFKSKKSDG